MTPYYQSDDSTFSLILGNTMEKLDHVDQKVDMILPTRLISCPKDTLNASTGHGRVLRKGEWDRATSLDNINAFNKEWLSKCRNILKESGTIFVSGTYHNIFSVATCMVELGYKILNIIVWQKSDAKPTLSR